MAAPPVGENNNRRSVWSDIQALPNFLMSYTTFSGSHVFCDCEIMKRPPYYTGSDNYWPISCAIWQTGRRNSHNILLQSMRMSIKFTRSAISGASGNEAANSCSKNRIRLQHEYGQIHFLSCVCLEDKCLLCHYYSQWDSYNWCYDSRQSGQFFTTSGSKCSYYSW